MRPELLAELREWIEIAGEDLAGAELALRERRPLLRLAAFHAQQTVEKSLKALLLLHEVGFRKTHDIREIGADIVRIAPDLEPLVRRASVLTPYAVMPRYPTPLGAPSRDDAEGALNIAREVMEAVLARLPVELRSG